MLITKNVKVKWASSNKKWYESKGYIYTKNNDEFEVKTEELGNTSHVIIQYQCDFCLDKGINNIISIQWRSYCQHKNDILNKDACAKHSSTKLMEIRAMELHIKPLKYTKDEIKKMYLELYEKMGQVPSTKYINQEHRLNSQFPSIRNIYDFFGSLNKLKEYCNLSTNKIIYTEKQLLNLLKIYVNKNGYPVSKRLSFNSKNGLPSYETYVNAFGDDLVKIYELCGYTLTDDEKYRINVRGRKISQSKEEIINNIFIMQKEINRPLMYDDFRNPKCNAPSLTMIRNYWGTMNKMKEELGLEIIQEDMVIKNLNIEQAKEDIKRVCDLIYISENRKMITTKDIDRNCNVQYSTYQKVFKNDNTTLRDYIISLEFQFQREGNGLNYKFKDGEKVRSQHELDFSKILRDKLGLQYNKDYFRDVKYKAFINDYVKNMDCDYIINYNNKVVYIEVVGMLRDYKDNWREIELKSKSKIRYIEHLKLKEQMLKDNNLEYYILFPSDLQEDFLISILNS